MNSFALGLDIGTSSIKLLVIDSETKQVVLQLSKSTQDSKVSYANNKEFNEQSVDVLLKLVADIFEEIPDRILSRVKGIQICGQVVYVWKRFIT